MRFIKKYEITDGLFGDLMPQDLKSVFDYIALFILSLRAIYTRKTKYYRKYMLFGGKKSINF